MSAQHEQQLIAVALAKPELTASVPTDRAYWRSPGLAQAWDYLAGAWPDPDLTLTADDLAASCRWDDATLQAVRAAQLEAYQWADSPAALAIGCGYARAIESEALVSRLSSALADSHARLAQGTPAPSVWAELEAQLSEVLARADRTEHPTLGTLSAAWMDRLEPGATMAQDRLVRTGFGELDRLMVGGMRRGHVHVVAGSTNVGKSHYCLAVADHAATAGHRVDYWTLEDGPDELYTRLLSRRCALPLARVMYGPLDVPSASAASVAACALGGLGDRMLFGRQRQPHLGMFMAHVTATAARRDTRLIVVDYLQRLRGGRGSIYERTVEAMRAITDLAQRTGAAVLVASQRNAVSDDPNRSLKGAGDIAEDAYTVVVLEDRRLPRGEDETWPVVEARVTKNKSGVHGSSSLQRHPSNGALFSCDVQLARDYAKARKESEVRRAPR
jgi:replicative DNA helicase